MSSELQSYADELARAARRTASNLAGVSGDAKARALHRFAATLREARQRILSANASDLAAATAAGLAAALLERLKLDDSRIDMMADGVDAIADQPDPVGATILTRTRPDGLRIEQRRVPIGVVLFVYESRPNVTADAAALCFKSGNAVILRGGKEALHSNRAIVQTLQQAFGDELSAISKAVQLVDNPDRALFPILLKMDRMIDLVIPRGGESLMRTVVNAATIPVLKHLTGNCHIYVDASATSMQQMVRDICVNAKTSYPGGAVCNAVEHILFHRDASLLLPLVCQDLVAKGVEIRGDERTRAVFPGAKPVSEADWATEYLSLIVGIKVVDSIEEAIEHINEHGSHHTDAILSTSDAAIERFVTQVDSASVLINASTRLADGGEYGLGAEIGISTDKLHARGPMGAADLTTYKWVVTGQGHLRQ